MTHAQLVNFAGKWLRNAGRCPVVFTECTTGGSEQPDAIGYRYGGRNTVLIECKVSRADFVADRRKWFRRPGYGVGNERWYMAPPGIIRPAVDLVDGWGLLEVTPRGRGATVRRVVVATVREVPPHEVLNERAMLWSYVRLAQMAARGERIIGNTPRTREVRAAVTSMVMAGPRTVNQRPPEPGTLIIGTQPVGDW